MIKKINVEHDDTLLNYVVNCDTGYNRKKLKSLLKNDCISINNKVTSQFNHPVKKDDLIQIKAFNERFGLTFEIIYEDDNIIVIDKPAGLLSVPFDENDKETAYDLVNEYIQRLHPRSVVYPVHRLDQGTSGVLMFAKNTKIQGQYQNDWNKLTKERVYIAYVEGKVLKEKDTIVSKLNIDNSSMVFSSNKGKKAITHYQVLQRLENNTILRVAIDTGRQNQIRVHLKDINHSIVGDKKYGARSNPLKRLGLHAYKLTIKNPTTNEVQNFIAPTPKVFKLNIKVD